MPPQPPPGKLVHVGDHRLHILVSGAGSPAVVFEAGGASWSMDWGLVQPEVARFTTACVYDRAGLGWSEPGPLPRTSERIAQELRSLLGAAGVPRPYILVGASFGGHVVRTLATSHPDEVAGVVLLDARHQELDARMPAAWKKLERAAAIQQRFLRWAARWRVLKLLGSLMSEGQLPPMARRLGAVERATYLEAGFGPQAFTTNLAELEACAESDRQVAATGTLGDLPLTVIRHGIPDLFSAMRDKDAEDAERAWQEMQRRLSLLSTRGQLMVAERSGHAIPIEDPEIVVRAVREMVEGCRHAGGA